jgi:hypothetical protein
MAATVPAPSHARHALATIALRRARPRRALGVNARSTLGRQPIGSISVYPDMGMSAETIFEHRQPVRKPGWRKALPWVAAVVAVGVLIGVLLVKYANTGHSTSAPLSKSPAVDVSKVPNTVKLPPSATRVARQFIETAVARKRLDYAYTLVTDEIKQGQSLESWRGGNIAVIPYPADAIEYAPMKIDFSYPREAQVEIALLPKPKAKIKPQLFLMDLVKRRGKWLVNSWVPRSTPPIPSSSEGNGGGS